MVHFRKVLHFYIYFFLVYFFGSNYFIGVLFLRWIIFFRVKILDTKKLILCKYNTRIFYYNCLLLLLWLRPADKGCCPSKRTFCAAKCSKWVFTLHNNLLILMCSFSRYKQQIYIYLKFYTSCNINFLGKLYMIHLYL